MSTPDDVKLLPHWSYPVVSALSELVDHWMQLAGVPDLHKSTQGTGVKVAILDSTPWWSPLLCRHKPTDSLAILAIEELFELTASPVVTTERGEEIKLSTDWQVWNGHNKSNRWWKDIKHVIRHHHEGEIIRVNTGHAVVDVTPNHSLIAANGRTVNADAVVVGQKLCPTNRMLPGDFKSQWFLGSESLAWLLGLWSAEGSCPKRKAASSPYMVKLSNKNIDLLERSADIFRTQFNVSASINSDGDGMYACAVTKKAVYHWFKQHCSYKGEKRVPNAILNAPRSVQMAFLRGYNAGDGYTKPNGKHQYEFVHFTTKHQLLASGLVYLAQRLLDQPYNLFTRPDKPGVISIQFNQPGGCQRIESSVVKKVERHNYVGLVYDLETQDHNFGCGVGGVRLHNTGVDAHHPDLADALDDVLDFTGENTFDYNGHGSHVASLVGARANSIGIRGAAPSCRLGSFKCLDRNGSGTDAMTARAISAAVNRGYDILSMSWGSRTIGPSTRAALVEAYRAGKILLAAFGNGGPTSIGDEPGRMQICTGVVAYDAAGRLASFATRGAEADVGVVGVDVVGCAPGGGYVKMSGSSQCAPRVAGIAACILAKHREHGGKTDLNNQDDWDSHLRAALAKAKPAADGTRWFLTNPKDLLGGGSDGALPDDGSHKVPIQTPSGKTMYIDIPPGTYQSFTVERKADGRVTVEFPNFVKGPRS